MHRLTLLTNIVYVAVGCHCWENFVTTHVISLVREIDSGHKNWKIIIASILRAAEKEKHLCSKKLCEHVMAC